jgi:hypothetical protein
VLLCVQCHHQVLLMTEHELQQLLWQLTHAPLHLPILHLLLCLRCFCRQVLLTTSSSCGLAQDSAECMVRAVHVSLSEFAARYIAYQMHPSDY